MTDAQHERLHKISLALTALPSSATPAINRQSRRDIEFLLSIIDEQEKRLEKIANVAREMKSVADYVQSYGTEIMNHAETIISKDLK